MEKLTTLQDRLDELVIRNTKTPARISSLIDNHQVNRAGTLEDLMDSADTNLVAVGTDTGAFVKSGREIATENLMGCVGLFIKGKNGHGLIHLTPSSKLGYSSPGQKVGNSVIDHDYLAQSTEKIIPTASKLGPIETLEVVIVGNLLDERPELEEIKKTLSARGIKKIKIEILPLDYSLLAYLPENDPDHLIATGFPVQYIQRGRHVDLTTNPSEFRNEIIPINSTTGQTVELPQRPEVAIEEIHKEVRDKLFTRSDDFIL